MTFIIGTPYASGAGYYRNDDTPSGGKKAEADIRTCPHCQAIIKLSEWDVIDNGGKGGGWCQKCFAPVCRHCAAEMKIHGCRPFLKQIEEQMEFTHRNSAQLEDFFKIAGMEPARPVQPIFTGLNTER